MDSGSRHIIETRYSPAELWNIAEESVLSAAHDIAGVRPSLLTPVNRYIPDEVARVRYFGALQDWLLRDAGLKVDFESDPPLGPDDLPGADFFALVEAVDERLTALAKGA